MFLRTVASRRDRLYNDFCSVWYVLCCRSVCVLQPTTSFCQDVSTFLIIVYSAKRRVRVRAQGMPNLLDRIVRDATVYFLFIFAGHLLVIFFEFFAPVSVRPEDVGVSPLD